MATYYVKPSIGSDANNGTDWTAAHAVATITRALALCSTAGGHTILIEDGETTDESGAYINLNKEFTAEVVVRPRTLLGPYQQGASIGNADSSNAYFMLNNPACANMTFRNLALVPQLTATTGIALGYNGDVTNIRFYDCSYTMPAINSRMLYSPYTTSLSGVHFIRCICITALASTAAIIQIAPAGAKPMSDFRIEDCILTSNAVYTAFIHATCADMSIRGNRITNSGSSIVLHIGDQNALGLRSSNVVVEDNIITNAASHCLYVNADSATIRRNKINVGGTGDYGIVLKWGSGYDVYCNRVVMATSTAGAAAFRIKAINTAADASVCGVYNNTATGIAANQQGVYVSKGDDDQPCLNTAFVNNAIVGAAGFTAVVWPADAQASGTVDCDHNRFDGGSGNSNILGTTCTTAAAMAAAWTAGGFSGNASHSALTADVDASSLIPSRTGNCRPGMGSNAYRALGAQDYYGRPKLRADADCIGAVYPQRNAVENILLPVSQFPLETA